MYPARHVNVKLHVVPMGERCRVQDARLCAWGLRFRGGRGLTAAHKSRGDAVAGMESSCHARNTATL